MAASNLLALIDDIASILDDVSLMTKVAAKKTAGVLGDDLALNAQQVTGVSADRELPVVWAVAKGSLRNKAILVPAALLISAFIPWLIQPLLMAGGLYLCFEGAEKIVHRLLHSGRQEKSEQELRELAAKTAAELQQLEKTKVNGAIRTDFILSAEIIVITLGTVGTVGLLTQVSVLIGIAVLMTVGVYGLVAGIVKLDDAGLWLSQRPGSWLPRLGRGIVRSAPWLMKGLSVVGTLAMFLVGGGILVHGLSPLAHWVHGAEVAGAAIPGVGHIVGGLTPTLLHGVIGLGAGLLVLAVWSLVQRLRGQSAH